MNNNEIEMVSKMKFVKEVFPEPIQAVLDNLIKQGKQLQTDCEAAVKKAMETATESQSVENIIKQYKIMNDAIATAIGEIYFKSVPIRIYEETADENQS